MQINKLELYKIDSDLYSNYFVIIFIESTFVEWVKRLPKRPLRDLSILFVIKRLSKHFYLDQGFPWSLWLLSPIIIVPQIDPLYQKFLQNLQRQPQIWHRKTSISFRFLIPMENIKIVLPMLWWLKLWLTSQKERPNSNSNPKSKNRTICLQTPSSYIALHISLSGISPKMALLLDILWVILLRFRTWKRYQTRTSLVYGNLVQKLNQYFYSKKHKPLLRNEWNFLSRKA